MARLNFLAQFWRPFTPATMPVSTYNWLFYRVIFQKHRPQERAVKTPGSPYLEPSNRTSDV
jgi:hypothetical protein